MTIRELLEEEQGSYKEISIEKDSKILFHGNVYELCNIDNSILDMEVLKWDYYIDAILWVISRGHYQAIVIEVE